MSFPLCKLCGVNPAACKAHIIPKQFYRRIRSREPHLYELHVEQSVERRFTQNGIWQQGIICSECDGKLGVLDDYGYRVLPEQLDQSKIKQVGPGMSFYELGTIDVEKFKRFLVALVWRASIASHDMFRFSKIGKYYEDKFKNILTNKSTSLLYRVGCVVIHLKPPRYDRILLPPFENDCEGVRIIQFYLYPWKLLVKLDRRPFGNTFNPIALKESVPAHALMMNVFSKGEIRILSDLQRKIKASSIGNN